MPAIIAEGCPNLTGRVLVAPILSLQIPIFEIVQSNSRIIAGDQQLDIAIRIVGRLPNRVDPGYLTAFGIPSPGRANMNLRIRFQAVRLVEDAETIQTTGNGVLSIRGESNGSYHIGDCRPERHTLVGNTP
jgi:hypothetical protein